MCFYEKDIEKILHGLLSSIIWGGKHENGCNRESESWRSQQTNRKIYGISWDLALRCGPIQGIFYKCVCVCIHSVCTHMNQKHEM